jgi:lysophospholipase L1-like esterase
MFTARKLFTNPLRNLLDDGGALSIFRNVGFIGDSLSSGEFESLTNGVKGYHDYYEYSWGQFIARKCGLKAYNFSKGGMKAKDFFMKERMRDDIDPFILEEKLQAYFIALGVNDLNHLEEYSCGFGSFDDVDFTNEDNNKDSFVGQYCRIIQKIRKISPKCRIFTLTIPRGTPKERKGDALRDKHAKFLNDLHKYFDYMYVVDLRKYAPIYTKKFREKYFLGGHMNALGYKLTADMVITYCNYIIHKHHQDFTQVGFINKGIHNESAKW